MEQHPCAEYDGSLPSKARFRRCTQPRVRYDLTSLCIANEVTRRSGTQQRSQLLLCLGTRLHINNPNGTAVIEMPKNVKTELHKFGACLFPATVTHESNEQGPNCLFNFEQTNGRAAGRREGKSTTEH